MQKEQPFLRRYLKRYRTLNVSQYAEIREPISPCGALSPSDGQILKSDSIVILIAEDKSTVEMTVGELLPYSLRTYNSLSCFILY